MKRLFFLLKKSKRKITIIIIRVGDEKKTRTRLQSKHCRHMVLYVLNTTPLSYIWFVAKGWGNIINKVEFLFFPPLHFQNNESRQIEQCTNIWIEIYDFKKNHSKKVIKGMIERTADRIRVNDLKAKLLLQIKGKKFKTVVVLKPHFSSNNS